MNNQPSNAKDDTDSTIDNHTTSLSFDADIRKNVERFFAGKDKDSPIIVDMPYAKYSDDHEGMHDASDEEKNKYRKAAANVNDYRTDFKAALKSAVARSKNEQNDPSTISQDKGFFISGEKYFTDEYDLWQKLTHRPVVYIVYFRRPKQKKWSVYVGETNHIINRTVQHVSNIHVDQSGDEGLDYEDTKHKEKTETTADKTISQAIRDGIAVRQLVIWHRMFNKSLTLDIENKLIDYTESMDNVESLNARPNAQDIYYTYVAKNPMVSLIWGQLSSHNDDIVNRYASLQKLPLDDASGPIFIGEDKIWQTSMFKFSPYHTLGEEQLRGLEEIVLSIKKHLESRKPNDPARLYFIAGAAGTGKSVLLTALYYKLGTYFNINNPSDSMDQHLRFLTYNKELQKIYADIGDRAGLTGPASNKTQPLNPTAFINKGTPREKIFKEYSVDKNGKETTKYLQPRLYWLWPFDDDPIEGEDQQHADSTLEKVLAEIIANKTQKDSIKDQRKTDVVLIDEAHLLFTQAGQGYQGDSQLHDILRRAKIVVAVFDPNQIMNNTQRWDIDYDIDSILSDDKLDTKTEHEQKMIDCGTIHFQDDKDRLGKRLAEHNNVQWDGDTYQTFCFPLRQQFRIDAGDNIIEWIRRVTTSIQAKRDDTAQEQPTILPIPANDKQDTDKAEIDQNILPSYHTDFTITVCDSPQELWDAIHDKRQAVIEEQNKQLANDGLAHLDLCRVLATYDWPYTKQSSTVDLTLCPDDVWRKPAKPGSESTFSRPWNGTAEDKSLDDTKHNDPWNSRNSTEGEIGSYYTIQGFDLNYAGVIIGPSVRYNAEDDCLEFHPEESKDPNIKKDYDGILKGVRSSADNAGKSEAEIKAIADAIWFQQKKYIQNQFNVLITRPVHGLYLFAVDEALQQRLKQAAQEGRLEDMSSGNQK